MQNEKIIGGWTLSNHGGLAVIDMTDESMTVRWYDNEETEECEIIYEVREDSEDGELEPCINYHGTLYFLADCMRVR